MPTSAPARKSARPDRRFYTYAALFATLVMFAGFSRTYFLMALVGAPPLSWLLHVHGLVMTLWFSVFIVQARLVATRRVDLHRRLGWFAAALAIIVVVLGGSAAVSGARNGHTSGGLEPLVFMMIPLSIMFLFTLLTGVALLYRRRRPDIHRRLMLLASVSMLTPAIARLPIPGFKAAGPKLYIALTLLLVLACASYDTFHNRRLHPAFGWGAGLLFLSFPLRMLLAKTETWLRIATWLTA